MNSISPSDRPDWILEGIARKVAFESRLPWRVEELRAKAVEAYETAELPAASLGLSREQVYRRMLQSINDQVKMASEGMDRLPPGEEKPAPKRIEAALGTFTAEQWTILVEDFGQVDVEESHAYLSFTLHP